MTMVRAVFENGVFRPTGDVSLPERCVVEFEPRVVPDATAAGEPLAELYDILSRSYETGETDIAARHNEHQP